MWTNPDSSSIPSWHWSTVTDYLQQIRRCYEAWHAVNKLFLSVWGSSCHLVHSYFFCQKIIVSALCEAWTTLGPVGWRSAWVFFGRGGGAWSIGIRLLVTGLSSCFQKYKLMLQVHKHQLQKNNNVFNCCSTFNWLDFVVKVYLLHYIYISALVTYPVIHIPLKKNPPSIC